jgi:hypothetical protein
VAAYAYNTRSEMRTFKTHRDEFVHVRENRLGEVLKSAGLTFTVLSQVKGEPLVLLQELTGAGVRRADDRLNLIAAVQAGDQAAYEKVLQRRSASFSGVKATPPSLELAGSGL